MYAVIGIVAYNRRDQRVIHNRKKSNRGTTERLLSVNRTRVIIIIHFNIFIRSKCERITRAYVESSVTSLRSFEVDEIIVAV